MEQPLFSREHPIWQPMSFQMQDAVRYDMGPLSLIISRREEEWRFRYQVGSEALREVMRCAPSTVDGVIEHDGKEDSIERVAAHDDADVREIQLQPLLADRFVSARPEIPFTVAAGSYASVFVTTPLWLRVMRLPERSPLIELPSFRPGDTWMGPSTGDGPLGYASRIAGRLSLEHLRLSPMRAISLVTLKNSGSAPLFVPRIIIPAPELRLFMDEQGRFWSNEIHITRGKDGELSDITYFTRAPEAAGKTTVISEPRSVPSSIFARAMSSIIGN